MKDDSAVKNGPPNRQLHILFVEDDGTDLQLCLSALKNADFTFKCDLVSTPEAFVERLSTEDYDVILADYQLRDWTAMDALSILHKKCKDIPFILVTGALGDEKAVECLKQGVDDYILKEHISQLPLAVSRALERKHAREERRLSEVAVRENEQRFRTLAEAIVSPIFIYQGTACRYVNRAAEEVTGYTREELMNTSSWEIIHPDSRDVLIEQGLSRLQGTIAPLKFELKILTKKGDAKWLDITIRLIQFDGNPAGLFTGFDITDRKSVEEEILHRVSSDPLTGLANCRGLTEGFATEASRSRRTGRCFSLLLFDLDDLKKINDAHGHLTGSRALCRLANILRNQCRNTDIAARHGGDEFAVILPETNMEGAKLLARRICERLSSDGQQPGLAVSFGAAVYPQDGQTYEELFGAADSALYQMKANGKPHEMDRVVESE